MKCWICGGPTPCRCVEKRAGGPALSALLALAGCFAGLSLELDKQKFGYRYDAWEDARRPGLEDAGLAKQMEREMKSLAASICAEDPAFWGCGVVANL